MNSQSNLTGCESGCMLGKQGTPLCWSNTLSTADSGKSTTNRHAQLFDALLSLPHCTGAVNELVAYCSGCVLLTNETIYCSRQLHDVFMYLQGLLASTHTPLKLLPSARLKSSAEQVRPWPESSSAVDVQIILHAACAICNDCTRSNTFNVIAGVPLAPRLQQPTSQYNFDCTPIFSVHADSSTSAGKWLLSA